MKTSLKPRDYRKCMWKRGEILLAAIRALAFTTALAYFFYRSFWAVIPLSAAGAAHFRNLREKKAQVQREELAAQFKECILSVAASLKAGYAVENAFLESREDMRSLYGEDSSIYQELETIRRGLVINVTLEELLKDLADRSGCPEIEEFSQVFSIAKRNGGNLGEVIGVSSELIGRKIAARQEMWTFLGGRRMEQSIMRLVPFGILLYVGLSAPEYFSPLYHNLQGNLIMSGCLLIYLAACGLGEKILKGISQEICCERG